MSFFLHNRSKTLKYASFAALLLSFSFVGRVEAQSGRRTSKPVAAPSPDPLIVPENATKPSPARSLVPLNEKVTILIGRHRTKRRLQSEDTIFASFVNRLTEDPKIDGASIGDMERQDSVLPSKNERQSLVVLLSFEIDSFQNGTIILNPPDLQVEYQIFEPVTGK